MLEYTGGTGAKRPVNVNILNTSLSFGYMDTRDISRVSKIIIHHTGVGTLQSPEQIHNYHKHKRGWAGAGYNFYVRKSGQIYRLRPMEYVPAHCKGWNSVSIGVCFEGNFDQELMSTDQIDAGVKLLSYLVTQYGIKTSSIHQHKAFGDTACPGRKFPFDGIVNGVINAIGKYNVLATGISVSRSIDSSDRQSSIAPQYTNSSYDVYMVKKGDTMYGIANKVGVDLNTLIAINSHIKNPNLVRPGDYIYYPSNNISRFNQIASDAVLIASNTMDMALDFYSNTAQEELMKEYEANRAKISHQETVELDEHGNKKLEWEKKEFALPGYDPCTLVIELPDGTKRIIPFLISPSNASDSRSNAIQPNKTNGGWFVYRLGPNLTQLSFSGYMLDTKHEMERHAFLQDYKTFVVDRRSDNHEYFNENTVSLFLEGIQYIGYITNLSFSKSAVQQFLYQYNIQFLVIEDRQVFVSDQSIYREMINTPKEQPTMVAVADGVNNLLTGKSGA